MSTFCLFLLLILLLLISDVESQKKQKLVLYSLPVITPTYSGGYVVGAQRLAVNDINNRSDILSNYELSIKPMNTEGSKTKALTISLSTASTSSLLSDDNETISIPIILGPPWSSLSITISPALSAFNWGHISSSATSVLLSDSSSYPTFYRTIASDRLQSEGIILLCQQFNWTSIGVLYVNDNFGVYLTNGILELALKNGIKANAVAYFSDDPSSYINAANTIKQIGVFIIVIIAHQAELTPIFNTLNNSDLWGFPYFYLGVDSWLDQARIQKRNVTQFTQGYLGTVPWQPSTLDREAYDKNDLGEIYDVATGLFHSIVTKWNNEFAINPNFSYGLDTMNSKSIYGWDTVYALGFALDIFDKTYNIKNNILNMNSSFIIHKLNEIIINQVSFLSVTGNVSMSDNGDRENGLYAFGNVVDDNGRVGYFGYFSNNFVEVQFDSIVWPKDFVDKGIIPRSDKLINIELESINNVIYIIVTILCIISILLVFMSIIVTFLYRDNKIIKAASWRLNLITSIGCVMSYSTIIIYGVKVDDILCNAREWLVIISWTLVFMPLFAKTYRVSALFTAMLQLKRKEFTDSRLVLFVLICVSIDIVILSIFTIIEPDIVHQYDSTKQQVHALEDIQYVYLACTKKTYAVNLVFYGIIGVWKLAELIFGIYIVLIVSKIGLKSMNKFNETKSQFKAIIFTFIMIGFAAIPLISSGDDENIFYIVISIVTISVCNVVWSVNLLPRLIAVYRKKEAKFELNETEMVGKWVKRRCRMKTQQSRAKLWQSAKMKSIEAYDINNIDNNNNDITPRQEQVFSDTNQDDHDSDGNQQNKTHL